MRFSGDNRIRERKRSKSTGQCIYGMTTRQRADGGNTTGKRKVQHQRVSLYGSLKPFLSFRKRKERNGFKKRSFIATREKRFQKTVLTLQKEVDNVDRACYSRSTK